MDYLLTESLRNLKTAVKVKSILYPLMSWAKRNTWALLIAYMVGIHNFYRGEDKTLEDIAPTIELNEVQADSAPKV